LKPPLGDLGATYGDHLRLIGKRVVDFLLALNELFSLGVTAEALRAIIGSKSAILLERGLVDPKFQVEGVAPINHSSSQRTRLIDLSYGIQIWTDLSSVLSQFTCVTARRTDRRTDRILIARPRLHSMQRGKNVYCFSDVASLCKYLVSTNNNRSHGVRRVLQLHQTNEILHQVMQIVQISPAAVYNFCKTGFYPHYVTRCSAIAERPRCRVRYSFRQK